MKKISIKNIVIICAAVMVISMVPIFAANANDTTTTENATNINSTTPAEKQLKHQYKYQKELKNGAEQVNSDCARVQNRNMNCTENCAENQYRYSNSNKNRLYNCNRNCTS